MIHELVVLALLPMFLLVVYVYSASFRRRRRAWRVIKLIFG